MNAPATPRQGWLPDDATLIAAVRDGARSVSEIAGQFDPYSAGFRKRLSRRVTRLMMTGRIYSVLEPGGKRRILSIRPPCAWCGQLIPSHRIPRAIYCCVEHSVAANRARHAPPAAPRVSRDCSWCGQPFTSSQPSAIYCCRTHAVAAGNALRDGRAKRAAEPRSHAHRIADLEAMISAPGTTMAPPLPGAACAGHPTVPADAWTEPVNSTTGRAAVRVCRQCPAHDPCLAWALTLPAGTAGILGGTGPAERRRLAATHDLPGEVA